MFLPSHLLRPDEEKEKIGPAKPKMRDHAPPPPPDIPGIPPVTMDAPRHSAPSSVAGPHKSVTVTASVSYIPITT